MPTILLIDDSAAHRAEIRRALEGARIFERILEAEDGVQGVKLLVSEPVDVVLCDLEMPGFDGEKLLRLRSPSSGGSSIPFLFITASQDMERRARLLEDGACDALTKPVHPADLVARLRLHLKIKKLQDELRDKNEMLARLSTTDEVTDLRTRRYARDALAIEFLRTRRYGSPLCVLLGDLDRFKSVNDRFGHQTGDAVLQGVSRILKSQVRVTDVAARWGGEEILVILSQNDLEGGRVLAERWRSLVEREEFAAPDGRSVSVSLSIGVAALTPDMETPDDLVAAADAALYRAKDKGRNRIEVAE